MIGIGSRIAVLGFGALALTASVASESFADASSVGPSRIGPHQYFAGVVNGKMNGAIVKVVCPGPANTGRALRRQTLEVTSPNVVASNFGETGSRARTIGALVGPTSTAAPMVTFHSYNHSQPFPTNVPVPCGGTGKIIFLPSPGSKTAKAATVTVTWVNVGADR